jgi:hypothetical protein
LIHVAFRPFLVGELFTLSRVLSSMTPERLSSCTQRAATRGYCGPLAKSELRGSTRVRHIGGLRFESPHTETFDEFLIGHLKYTLGKLWGRQQVKLPHDRQHAIVQWLCHYSEEQRRILGDEHDPNVVVSAKPTGQVMELMSVAEDLYRLALVDQLPEQTLKRLRKRESFQGARYELALAASFVRAGFELAWLSDTRKHAEFSATLKATNEQILVEAKSRRRPGILHETGSPPHLNEIRADVCNLYREALKKETDGKPFLISIDVNVPQVIDSSTGRESWLPDVYELLDRHPEPTETKPAKEFCLAFTNFNWHYAGANLAPAHQVVYTFPYWCDSAPAKDENYVALIQALDTYGRRPDGIF